jgi:hypothetical protein
MRLEVHERLALITLLPTKGDYAALKTIRRAREMLSFTPEEIAFYEMRTDVGDNGKPQTKWSPTKAAEAIKDCPVDEYTTHLFRDKLAEMNRKKELTEQFMSIYEKFVVDYK